MATLILSAAGAAIGGPLGGAVGSLLGRHVDRSLAYAPKARLDDLRVPSSRYGDAIPAIVGSMRVGGVVIWASTPVATATVSKSGTGQGISVSFAFAVSSWTINGVGRIWADGRLIRDREGQQDVDFSFRFHHGDEDQPADPLIASILGDGHAPAFRGMAYLMFENFDLSSFGNRLPLITVEIIGGSNTVEAEHIVRDRLDLGKTTEVRGHALDGFALVGDEVASALDPLVAAFAPVFRYDGGNWKLDEVIARHVVDYRLWQVEGVSSPSFQVGGQSETPTKVSVRYFDPLKDFAACEKSARRPGVERLRRIELPAAMRGETAKWLAFEQLSKASSEAEEVWLDLPLSYATICVGDCVQPSDVSADVYRVSEKTLTDAKLRFRLRRKSQPFVRSLEDSEEAASVARLARDPLSVQLIELPGAPFRSEPEIAVLISGGYKPFRPLPATISIGAAEAELTTPSIASPKGRLTKPLGAAPAECLDSHNVIEVAFDQDPMLQSCEDNALFAGENLLSVAGEFVQFAIATPLGNAKYELSRLVRGRFDSSPLTGHDAGSSVCVLNPAAMSTLKLPCECIGATATVRIFGPDGSMAEANLVVDGLAARPWAPAHLELSETPNGLNLSWVRRCKEGGAWLDGVDAPIGSSREFYQIVLSDQSDDRIEVHSGSSSIFIAASAYREFGPRPWRLEVRQSGDFAAGNPLIHTIG